MDKMVVSLCQMKVGEDKKQNVKCALDAVEDAKRRGSQLAVLPEMFCCPYDNAKFYEYSETEEDGFALSALKECAAKYRIAIAAGSVPERDQGKLYNTQYLVDEEGNIKGKHRKMHLFDIDIKGKIRFQESDVLTPGDQVTVSDLYGIKVGLAICYDLRFPEYFRILAQNGVQLVLLPAAFNMTTGPAHWETLLRCRALDNQLFIAAVSPARDPKAGYVAYGHSMVTGPWGDVKVQADEKACIKTVEINFRERISIMEQLPLLKHKRNDLYETVLKC